jgi:hypothetical protein
MQPLDVIPTEGDRENYRRRQEIADRQNAAYQEAYLLALGVLGPGWTPWMVLSLIDSGYHQGADRTPVATAFKVYRGEQRFSENSVYLRKLDDGTVLKADKYEELFGDLLTEPHPTRRMEIKGEMIAPPRYSLVWSSSRRPCPRERAEGSPAAVGRALQFYRIGSARLCTAARCRCGTVTRWSPWT